MSDVFPVLPNTSFFRRFDDEVVENRRRCALQFLEYLGQHFQLFTAKEFIKFFEVSLVILKLTSDVKTIFEIMI